MPTSSTRFERHDARSGVPNPAPYPAPEAQRRDALSFPLPMPADLAHISTEMTVVPHALIFVTRCVCGARIESMIDGRDNAGACPTDDAGMKLFEELADHPCALIERWQRDHRHCTRAARDVALPIQAAYLLEAAWERSVAAIHPGDHVPRDLYVLMSTGVLYAISLDDCRRVMQVEAPDTPLAGERAAHAVARDIARETGAEPIAAVTVAETWRWADQSIVDGTPMSGEREDALVLWATTPDVGVVRVAPISRPADSSAPLISEPVMVPLCVSCGLLDGVLAKPIILPPVQRGR